MKPKLIRTSTVAMSLDYLLKGQLSFLQNYYEVVAVSGSGEHLENVEQREKVRIVGISMLRQINLVQDFISLWKLYLLFRKEKPSIVHSITPKAGLISMAAAYFSGVPVRMHSFTGLIFPARKGFMHWLLKNMDRITCKFATQIIPEGEGVKRDLIDYHITRKPLKVIGNGNVNGIDHTFYDRKALEPFLLNNLKIELGIKHEDFIFIFVGRLVKDKGINELVEAFKKVNTKHQNLKLLLVGDYEKELDPLLPTTLQEIENNPNIIFVGFQNDVRPYFAVSHCLVFPSYREGFPNVVMQAGAMQLPSVVTDINGCNEIIQPEQNGLIIPPKNTKALEEAMLRILKDTALTKKMAGNARESIVSRFDQLTLWKLIKEEYDEQLRLADVQN